MKKTVALRFICLWGYLHLCLLIVAVFTPVTVLAGEKPKVALVMKSLQNPFFSKMASGARTYADRHDVSLDIFGIDRETDIDKQICIMEKLITQKYQAIILAPADSKALIPVCKKAIQNKIIVINVDNPLHSKTLEQEGLSIPFVGSDNRAGAELIGRYIRKRLKGKGRVMIIEGIRGVENSERRIEGLCNQFNMSPDIKVVASEPANWHSDEAFSLVTRLLEEQGVVDAIVCLNDSMALGALKAIELAGLEKKILVSGYDNIETVQAAMCNGLIHATVYQHQELMGEYGVRLSLMGLRGRSMPSQLSTPVDLVTREVIDKTIGLSISSLKNPYFRLLVDTAKSTAAVFNVRLVTADAENRDDKQLADILALIKLGAEVIIINPTHSATIEPGIELANRRGIPVIAVDRTVASGNVLSLIASDNTAGGALAADVIARHLSGKGRVVEIEGIPGTSATHDRGTGFNTRLKSYPDIQVVAREPGYFMRDRAQAVMAGLIARNIAFDAVFAHNDTMILGAVDALGKSTAATKILVGFDGIPEALMAVNQNLITATIAQIPEKMGRLAVTTAIQLFQGETVPKTVVSELELITH
ncbi:MAG: hypothetical protein CSA22_07920 [Deltaproteobacteria bacterium]|nr:MAG: hypothetical protein CSA22_07920 [Deltaproteobacteria bacterium]